MGWTTLRTWTDTEVPTAAQLNEQIRDNELEVGPHKRVRKTADESLSATTVLQDDDELFFAIAANEFWVFQLLVIYRTPAVADLKLGWSGPGGTSLGWALLPHTTTTTPPLRSVGSEEFAVGVDGTDLLAHILGSVIAAAAGNVRFRWAQNTSDAGTTTVRANSCLVASRIG